MLLFLWLGLWLVRLVYMRRCDDPATGLDWESYCGADFNFSRSADNSQ